MSMIFDYILIYNICTSAVRTHSADNSPPHAGSA